MKTLPLWKVVVERPLDLAELTRLADALPAAAEPPAEMRGVELERVDTTPRRTTIFISSSREGAKALADALGAKHAEATEAELRAPGPAAD